MLDLKNWAFGTEFDMVYDIRVVVFYLGYRILIGYRRHGVGISSV